MPDRRECAVTAAQVVLFLRRIDCPKLPRVLPCRLALVALGARRFRFVLAVLVLPVGLLGLHCRIAIARIGYRYLAPTARALNPLVAIVGFALVLVLAVVEVTPQPMLCFLRLVTSLGVVAMLVRTP